MLNNTVLLASANSSNWWIYLIIAIIVLAVVVVLIATGNVHKIKEWLVLAVAESEKELGSGTGQLKLRNVYNKFIEKFPKMSTFISFELFSKLVDKALKTLNNLLDSNEAIKDYVEGTTEDEQVEDTEEINTNE